MTIYLIGHKNPDSDSILSAIAYEYVKKEMGWKNVKAARAGKINKETAFILKKFKLPKPVLLKSIANKTVIILDHNEISQAPNGVEKANIIEIIDHHRIGDLQTGEPLLFMSSPVGATATLIYMQAERNKIKFTGKIKGAILGAILSDTVILKSPTTTEHDIKIVKKISKEIDVDYKKLGMNMFKEKTKISSESAKEIIESDYKILKLKKKIGISQIETVDANLILSRKKELLKHMENKAKKEKLNIIIAMITDIINEKCIVLVPNKNIKEIEKAFKKKIKDNELMLKGVISRKKQIVPVLKRTFF